MRDFKQLSSQNVNKFLDYYGIDIEQDTQENLTNFAYYLGLVQIDFCF